MRLCYILGMEKMPRSNDNEPDYLAPRREVDRSFEQNEVYRATEVLTKLGLLKRMSDLDLYHGRAKDSSDKVWHVDASFNNGGNATSNRNINDVPALNTSDINTAERFSKARGGNESELHHIVSSNPDARIIDRNFDWNKLSTEEKKEIYTALTKTLPNISEGAPLDFKDRDIGLNQSFKIGDIKSPNSDFLYIKDAKEIANKLQCSENAVLRLGAARNTWQLLKRDPRCTGALLGAYLHARNTVRVETDGSKIDLPINRDFIGSWLKKMDVVGMKMRVDSATLGETIDNYLLFELDDVDTEQRVEGERQYNAKRLGNIALKTHEKLRERHDSSLTDAIANNPYIKPREIVTKAKEIPGFKDLLEASAGVREGYTIEQHTETALGVFDNNYADKLPTAVLPLMRLSLLVHDIGKGQAVKNNEKENQQVYNEAYAKDFLALNNIDEKTANLIIAMIGDGMKKTSHWIVENREGSGQEMAKFCRDTMRIFLGHEPDTNDVKGLRNLLLVLQSCDSGAYTSMALTNSDRGFSYRNFPAFNNSFRQKADLTGTKMTIKQAARKAAS